MEYLVGERDQGLRLVLSVISMCILAMLNGAGIYFQHRRAYVMRWFQKDRPPEVWEFAPDETLGDIGTAQEIREICASAGSIAETTARLRESKAEAHKVSETERRYQAAVKCALELAKQISDDAMRDVLVSQIIALSVKAGHIKTARVLLRAIRSEKTQAELINNYRPLIGLST